MSKPKVEFSVDRPEQSVGFVFWKTTLLWQKKITECLKPLNITHVQFVLLAGLGWLQNKNSEVTQMMLAHHAEVDVMMTSKVIRSLEAKNLIVRHQHSTDTRAKSLSLTPPGRKLLEKALIIVEEADKVFFKPIQPNKNQFSDSLRALMTENLKAGDNNVGI